MKKIIAVIGLLAFAAAYLVPHQVEAQTNTIQQNIDNSLGNFNFKSVTLTPSYLENPSNTFKVFDSTGTNLYSLSPTNNRPIITQNGTNSYGVVDADIIFTNTAGTTRHMIFKNGILVNQF